MKRLMRHLRFFGVFSALWMLAAPAWSQPQWAEGEWRAERIAPGIRHIRHVLPEGPIVVHVLEIDLRRRDIGIETVLAKNRLAGREKTSVMAARPCHPGHEVIAAVNGDFFSWEGPPINMQVRGGEIIRSPRHRAVFAMDHRGRPIIDYFQLKGELLLNTGTSITIDHVNAARNTDELVLYNAFWSDSTHTNAYGTEVLLQPLMRFMLGDTVRMVVRQVRSHGPGFPLRPGLYVLSGHGKKSALLEQRLSRGDTVALVFRLEPGNVKITEAVGGLPWLIREGNWFINWREEGAKRPFAENKHPRTAVGYTVRRDTLYLVTVDGRQQGYSVGMTLYELAEYMQKLGCYQALNLDGGGSTTMVIRGRVVNRPSDATGERPVANAILVVRKKR